MQTRCIDLLQAIPDALAIADPAYKVLFWNQAAEKLYGISAAAALGQSIEDLLEIAGPAVTAAMVRDLVEKNGSWQGEVRHRPKGGDAVWVNWSIAKYPLEQSAMGFLSVARDISRYKHTEETLRESEERYRLLADLASEGILIHEQGTILEVNRALCEMAGCKAEDLIGHYGLEAIPFAPESKQAVLSHSQSGFEKPYEIEVISKRGNRVYVETQGKKLNYRGRDARLVRMRDITKEKEAQDALRASENRFRLLMENSNDIFYIIDEKGMPLHISGRITKILGYQPEELFGIRAFSGVHPDDLPHLMAEFDEALDKPSAVRKVEYRYRHKDGHWVDLETIGSNLLHDPAVRGIVLNIREITERKQSEERFRSFMKHFPGLAFIKDADGTILFVNEKFADVFGISPDDLIGKHNHDFLPAEFAEKVTQDDRRILSSWKMEYIEENFGNRVWNTCKFPIAGPGSGLLLAGFTLDITEAKKSEEERIKLAAQLQQAMKMEAIGRLAGGVAHDFNNLLTSITGNVELALMDLQKHNSLAEPLNEIGKAADSAALLTRQLLAFSRKQPIEPKVLDLNQLISRMQKMLVRLIGEDIELQMISGEQLGAVKIDPGQFEQIVVNLAVNARDAMPNGGTLVIETANVNLKKDSRNHSLSPSGNHVMLAVRDTGEGMSEQVKAHLFEPFFTTKEKGEGTGLGLAVTYGAVQQAGGSIEVESELEIGTSFRIYLPRVQEKAERLELKGQAKMPGGTETVLLVEDEAIVRDLADRILKRLGYHVLQAASGGDALVLAKQYPGLIHLLFTDVVMPGMNGKELAVRMTQIHPEAKVLYTSGYLGDATSHRGVVDDGLNFISKPYSPQALAEKLRQVISG
jgi:two-component system, cell cycle sensor histidine kinase and response regulator CckA